MFIPSSITYGNADDDVGGGISLSSADPILRNLIVTENNGREGGGMYNRNSDPILSNVTFEFNTATQNGGAIRNFDSSPVIIITFPPIPKT